MKHFIYLLAVCLVSICFSCSNDTFTLDEPTSQSLKMQNDSIRTLRYCYGCLPMITAYHDPSFNEFTVAWSGFGASPISHPVTISLNADGGSKSQTITNANGIIKLSIYSSSYTGS